MINKQLTNTVGRKEKQGRKEGKKGRRNGGREEGKREVRGGERVTWKHIDVGIH